VSTREAVRDFFDSTAYLERNPIIPIRARIVEELLGEVRGGHVLELGCGDGSVSRPLLRSGNHLTLVDFSAAMLERARAAIPADAPVELVEADILEYVPERAYDAVICVGVLAHVPSVEGIIARVAQVVAPGGLCVLQITDDASPVGWLLNRYYRWRGERDYELRRTSARALAGMAARHGLVDVEMRRYGLLLPGLGRLPAGWERRIETAVAARPRLRVLGAELIVCFRRVEPGSGHGRAW
jgi:2-polyprenyl-3-methyl-5-hydroxy-6-metoxy-1,4-benzoquinol methylase